MGTLLAIPGMAHAEETQELSKAESSLITILGIAEGDVLEYLERHGATSLYRLIQTQEWPSSMVIMAVGALIRQGLIRGDQHQLEPSASVSPGQGFPWHPASQYRHYPDDFSEETEGACVL